MKNSELIYRAMSAGVKTAKELAQYVKGQRVDDLAWLDKDWKPTSVTHYTNRTDKK